jgi:hypothetical protein
MKRKDKDRENLKVLIDKMFEIAGHSLKFEDVEGSTDNWFQQYTMTESQNKEWRAWGVKFLNKQSRYNKKMAEQSMAWLDLYCGLRTVPDNE